MASNMGTASAAAASAYVYVTDTDTHPGIANIKSLEKALAAAVMEYSTVDRSGTSGSSSTASATTGPDSVAELRQLKAAMIAVPSGSFGFSSRRKGKKKGAKPPKDGVMTAKVFNVVAGRPIPMFVTSEQSIIVTMSASLPTFHTGSAVSNTYTSFYFSLANFANYASYTSLFDQYKFLGAELWFTPAGSASSGAEMVTSVDLDDDTVPTTYNDVLAKQGSLSSSVMAGHYHRFLPHMAVAVYSGAFTSFANSVPQWIDSGSPSVRHYGLKVAIGPTNFFFNLEARIIVQFRAPGVP